jgi:hypothetical protein
MQSSDIQEAIFFRLASGTHFLAPSTRRKPFITPGSVALGTRRYWVFSRSRGTKSIQDFVRTTRQDNPSG